MLLWQNMKWKWPVYSQRWCIIPWDFLSRLSDSNFFLWCEMLGFGCTAKALQCSERSCSLYVFRITWHDQITCVSLETEGIGRTWALCSLRTCHVCTCGPETSWSRFYCWLACFCLWYFRHLFSLNDIQILYWLL